ncbi:DUF4145 domain-containing protein [Lactobacillus sp. ESL0684]|uniref:DUF4145 domain-containing protein n=1 Tax=Lactobacillus sp. ESL0684 TaxID=2983213 RepID=UPI0023F79E58|nr:DUF4145 domain-containing protein [Lactobacillus sp. ESL0684]WEV42970.1 DUF4145 domain-containing protein [Lactobacillus sp. ESL0684]
MGMNNNIEQKDWADLVELPSFSYTCGYCGSDTGTNKGYRINSVGVTNDVAIYICPICGCPTYKEDEVLVPGTTYGEEIINLPDSVSSIYDEARNSYRVGAYTGVILICRKILANVAVYYGAKDGQSFVKYIDYLIENGYVPEKSKEWIDEIRLEGNSATHNQTSKNKDDAQKILDFVQMLLLIN